MTNTLAVFGATGVQGGSIINSVLNDSDLSSTYTIRAITRDVHSDKAKRLQESVQVVRGDSSDRDSLDKALNGVHTVFAMTVPSYGPDAIEAEYTSGKAIADAAVAAGVQYLILSTLPSAAQLSSGRLTRLTMFDAKARIEAYIRTLPIKSAFFAPGSFMQNLTDQPALYPKPAGDGRSWVLERPVPPATRMPLIDAAADSGKYVGAMLAAPDAFAGKTLCAATALYSLDDVAAAMSRHTGKTIVAKQVSRDELRASLPFPPDILFDMFDLFADYGYYGPETPALVGWAAENARGKLTTLDEYFDAHPLKLA